MENLLLAIFTGLTTGGISCLAVQGGLLTSATTNQQQNSKQVVGMFLIAKLFVYTLLGAGLGMLGSALTLSPNVQGWMQIFAGIFMLVTAARLLDLHPVFRYFVIQPPRAFYRLARSQSRNSDLLSPALLGGLTVLLPCGVTQAMMVLAIASGSAISGAMIMFGFTLGTTPVFYAIGITALTLLKKKSFAYVAACIVALLGIISINTGQILRGSAHTLQSYYQAALGSNVKAANSKLENGKQEVTIKVTNSGYESSVNTLKAGVPVKLTLRSDNVRSCARAFTIPKFNISRVLPATGQEVIEFTPKETGRLAYTCSMGMYGGVFNVIP